MFKFPNYLYTDVRIEDVFETKIMFTLGNIDDSKVRRYKAAFIRVFDGEKWYYSSTSEIDSIQKEIDTLAGYAKENENIDSNPIVQKFEVNRGRYLTFEREDVAKIPHQQKLDLLKSYFPLVESNQAIKMWKAQYIDERRVKEFYSSKGAELVFDFQRVGFRVDFDLVNGEKKFSESFQKGSNYYKDIENQEEEFKIFMGKCQDFMENSVPIKPGKYTVVLSPIAAGVFAHESFGHKSESDFMVGDETMKKEWAIGKKVGADILSIVDDGNEMGSGYVPYDDEGTKAKKTYLIDNGTLGGRLHSGATAAVLEEDVTGNARAMNFEYEPIVRMTTTYIMPGDKTKEQLFSEVEEGIFIDTIHHGSGMSTFTIAPALAYYIRDGRIAEPVNISVITGSVFETLGEIDGLSDKLELLSFVTGGCGKMEQWPLSVGFGGPYVRVKNINAQ